MKNVRVSNCIGKDVKSQISYFLPLLILSASYSYRVLPANYNSPITAHPWSQPFHADPAAEVLIYGSAGVVRRPLTLELKRRK